MNEIVSVYVQMIEFCLPFVVCFGFGNMAIATVLRAVFGGRLVIK